MKPIDNMVAIHRAMQRAFEIEKSLKEQKNEQEALEVNSLAYNLKEIICIEAQRLMRTFDRDEIVKMVKYDFYPARFPDNAGDDNDFYLKEWIERFLTRPTDNMDYESFKVFCKVLEAKIFYKSRPEGYAITVPLKQFEIIGE